MESWIAAPPSEEAASRYHVDLLHLLRCAVEVKDAGHDRGKGVFATRAIGAGEVLWRERPLAGVQETEQVALSPACSNCFRPLGVLEELVGGALVQLINHLSDPDEDADEAELALLAHKVQAAVDAKKLQGLMEGTEKLPLSQLLQLPDSVRRNLVPCRHACEAQYCSAQCEARAWDQHHCLLCPAQPSSSKGKGPAAAPVAGGSSGSSKGRQSRSALLQQQKQQPLLVRGVHVYPFKLQAFLEHAEECNDQLLLAAQVVARVLVAAHRLASASSSGGGADEAGTTTAAPTAATAAAATAEDAQPAAGGGSAYSSQAYAAALRQAWLPFAVAHKGLWWEVASVPEEEEEADYRQLLRDMVADSAGLLGAALQPLQAEGRALLTPEVLGSLVGMFELNNLALNIPSPVTQYFALLDDPSAPASAAARAAAAEATEGLREALADDLQLLDVQGTAFYALQSCVNHSCCPAARADADASGEAVLTAVRDIAAGEEVTISYIHEEALDLQGRRAALEGYGFTCACEQCAAEVLAAELAAA